MVRHGGVPKQHKSKWDVIRAMVEYRHQIGMSSRQASTRMGYSESRTLVKLEGTHQDIQMSTLFRYAAALGLRFKLVKVEDVPIDELPDKNGNSRNPNPIEERRMWTIGSMVGIFGRERHEESLEFWENEAS